MTAPRAYYNEIDPAAAHVLRHLIALGVIAPGEVDTRSIKDVQADDLKGFTQCHFFAGGGIWSIAARLAGLADDRPLWTGSCPCQPFSVAGKGAGADDPRHLWPDFFRLIRAARPSVVMGEQVAGAAGYGWFDGVAADLEGEGFAARAVDIPACALDAPHIRQRLYWAAVADSAGAGWDAAPFAGIRGEAQGERSRDGQSQRSHGADSCVMAITERDRLQGRNSEWCRPGAIDASDHQRRNMGDGASPGREQGQLAAPSARYGDQPSPAYGCYGIISPDAAVPVVQRQPSAWNKQDNREIQGLHADANGGRCAGRQEGEIWGQIERTFVERDLPRVNGTYWSDAEWIVCHDGKARRAKSGLRLLVDGIPGRVDLWRIGGNAIVPQVAAEVIGALMDVLPEWKAGQ